MEMSASPYPRVHEDVLWTGQEVLVWGGCTFTNGRLVGQKTGASFDPATNTWKLLDWETYANKRSTAMATRDRSAKPLALLTRDWIPGATLSAHMIETDNYTLIWGGWVARRTSYECGKNKRCPQTRYELIPDGIVIAWTGQIRGTVSVGQRPLGGAYVRVLGVGARLVAEGMTAPDGTFALDTAAGKYTLEVSKLGFETARLPVVVGRSEISRIDPELNPLP